MIPPRRILPFVAVTGTAGVGAAALAASPPATPRAVYPATAAAPLALPGCFPTLAPAASATAATGTYTASAALKGALGVLARAPRTGDKLPAAAIAQLERSRLRFDAAAARLVRTTPRGGRAWIVPVADVQALGCVGLLPLTTLRALPGSTRELAPAAIAPALTRALPAPAYPGTKRKAAPTKALPSAVYPGARLEAAPTKTLPSAVYPGTRLKAAPTRTLPSAVYPGTPRMGTPAIAAPARVYPGRVRKGARTLVAPVPVYPGRGVVARAPAPQEGVVVVAVGDAPGGGSASLADLRRNRAVPTPEPCRGPGGALVAVSGLAPNGVTEAFLTGRDGTAIKADVRDNAYSFIVPPSASVVPRYVVWMKRGLPQVTPLDAVVPRLPARVCAATARTAARPRIMAVTPAASPPALALRAEALTRLVRIRPRAAGEAAGRREAERRAHAARPATP